MGWKMVRDKQKEYCLSHGVSGQWRTSPDAVGALTAKLGEEYGEFAESRDPAELYDLLDVLNELIMVMDFNLDHLDAHEAKVARLGTFSMHLEWNPVPKESNARTPA
jgi:predicted house-cleaning noncanonical NTP pyrophosphatase (MazG superfamily)